ncbi:hypothetical protein KAI04_03845 [Candidatus Pacearchaeota archaeon]|nr:hypothetical protein [Candidatus Pacearchaeota archaeon]
MGKQWKKNNYCDIIPDILFGVDLTKCCYNHDVDYWKKPICRKEADQRLKRCFLNKYKNAGKYKLGKIISNIIYICLRLFGWIKW